MIYTRYIPGIHQVYTNVKVYTWCIPRIYRVYPWYIPCISPTLVYTWYIPDIYRLYVNIGDIAGIYHTKTSIHLFGTSHVLPSTGHIPDIYLLYPGIWPVEGGTWLVPNKCIEVFVWHIPPISPRLTYRRYIPGIYQVYTNVKVYTWYIPGI